MPISAIIIPTELNIRGAWRPTIRHDDPPMYSDGNDDSPLNAVKPPIMLAVLSS